MNVQPFDCMIGSEYSPKKIKENKIKFDPHISINKLLKYFSFFNRIPTPGI